MEKIPVIIDTDIGSDIDDTWALALILASDCFDVRLIMTVCEDVRYKAALAAKLCEIAGQEIPVVCGVGGETVCSAQAAWLAGEERTFSAAFEDAFARAVNRSPGLTVIELAPFTNLARILERYPGLSRDFRVTAMIGAIEKGYLNEDKAGAECNAALDPEAFNRVLAAGVKTEILPLDVCRDFILDKDCYRRVLTSPDPLARAVTENYRIWHRDYKGGAIKFDPETSSGILYDLLPVLRLICPEEFVTERIRLRADAEGKTVTDGGGFEAVCCLALKDKEKLLRVCADILAGERHTGERPSAGERIWKKQ